MNTFSPLRARRICVVVLALTISTTSTGAFAQLRMPGLNLPQLPAVERLRDDLLSSPGERLPRLDAVRELADVRQLRLARTGELLRRHPDLLEADPRGEPAVRREIVAWSPSAAGRSAAATAGLTVLRETRLDELGEVMLVLRVPEAADTAQLLEQLRAADPEGSYDFNHIYTGSGANGGPAAPLPPGEAGTPAVPGTRIGLVDSGVDAGHPVFRGASIAHWGCGDSVLPDAHGTAVAALMVGRAGHFRGVAPQARLFAADVYCNSATGGSAERIAGALAWLAREQVPVVNLSIVGPANQTLGRAVGAMVRRGHLLVAAVGNDGPAAPPLYPASYPGVVGVSAVDRRGRVLPEAGRGPQVMFAAPGNHMLSAAPGKPPYRQVRGTSYAAPIVAALLATRLPRPDSTLAAGAVAALAREAVREDGQSVSNESGLGIVGQAHRIDPASLR